MDPPLDLLQPFRVLTTERPVPPTIEAAEEFRLFRRQLGLNLKQRIFKQRIEDCGVLRVHPVFRYAKRLCQSFQFRAVRQLHYRDVTPNG